MIENNYLPEDDDQIKLTDLLEIEELQKAQDAVAKMARMATLITDENGVPLTEGSRFSRVCKEYCRKSEEGRKRCERCDRMGAIAAMKKKQAVYYHCHANLVDFSAPIMLNGRMIGSFIGGQVLDEPLDLDKIRITAREIGVDEEEFLKAAQETDVIPKSAIERCTTFIYEFAEILSAMAYKSYIAKKESKLALQAASAKTDFLANMSHEIRTPMNAIIGMSQIALREEMSAQARNYIKQVKTSADMLLTIINDILDYSKIEAGKMSVVEVDYSPVSMIKEVANIISNRVGDKNLEFLIDLDPSIPCELHGDDIRIKQIIVNLANNAVKFTKAGQVVLKISHRVVDKENIMLMGSIKDTGIGIKPEDLNKLFHSFEQVDSKRNRKEEGTGLGLAIVKKLVDTMDGKLTVESVYEKGSTFSFEIKQKIVNPVRCIELLPDCPVVLSAFSNPYVKEQMRKDMNSLGAQYLEVHPNEIATYVQDNAVEFVFLAESLVTPDILDFAAEHTKTKFVILSSYNDSKYDSNDNVVVLHKPVSIINTSAVLQHKSIEEKVVETSESKLDFKAPEANVLVVDDNDVNLTVAAGLLEPLKMKIDTALSGMEAVEMISSKRYDIIFMDHMMPDMDGIETTRVIRRFHPDYDDIPIVALTANALAGNKDLFLSEGMNDFVAKPIELGSILDVLRKWLPEEKIIPVDKSEMMQQISADPMTEDGSINISFLDTKYALSLLKTETLFWKVLKDYYNMIDKKSQKIKECETKEDIATYIVEVHALKSSSKQIGALSLSKKAEYLESAGNHHDISIIHELTDEMLLEYHNLQLSLAPYFPDISKDSQGEQETSGSGRVGKKRLRELMNKMQDAIEELDLDQMEEAVDELYKYQYSETDMDRLEKLAELVQDMDIDGCSAIIEEWRQEIK